MLSLGWEWFSRHTCAAGPLKLAPGWPCRHQSCTKFLPVAHRGTSAPCLDLRGLPRRGLLGDPFTQVPGCRGARGRGPTLGSLGVAARLRQGLHHLKAQLGWAPTSQIVHLQGCKVTCAGLDAAHRSHLAELPQPDCSRLRMASSNFLFLLLHL